MMELVDYHVVEPVGCKPVQVPGERLDACEQDACIRLFIPAVVQAKVRTEKARFIFDLLIDHPGKQIDADEIRKLRPGDLPSRHSVAASLSGLHPAWAASGRRYPFYWWAGRGKAPTKYAMKPTVAKLFYEARERLQGR